MSGNVVEGVKTVGYCIGTLVACATAWVTFGGSIPASQAYVQDEIRKITQVTESQATKFAGETRDLKSRVIDLQMQQNTARRDTFRAEEFNRQQELSKDPGNFAVKQRLNEIQDRLEEVKRDREKLEKERGN